MQRGSMLEDAVLNEFSRRAARVLSEEDLGELVSRIREGALDEMGLIGLLGRVVG